MQEYFMQHKVFYIAQKLSNKQSAKVICRFNSLRTALSEGLNSHMSIGKLIGRPRI